MTRVTINLHHLRHNLNLIKRWMKEHNTLYTVVSKVLCGHADTLRALGILGVTSIGDSRLKNLRGVKESVPDAETWYLRPPHLSAVEEVVHLSNVSLNSELNVTEALSQEATRQGKEHKIIIMIELGDLREGILPGSLTKFYERVFHIANVEVLGIGANLGCLTGIVPDIDQFMQLVLYRELLELKFNHKIPLISAGSSAVLPLLLEGSLPKAVNHFRIGEALFLGTDLIHGGTLGELRNDVIVVEAEIAEIKEKSLVPIGESTAMSPFPSVVNKDLTPGQRGYRALVTIGQLDTDVSGLTPFNQEYQIAGASSDITVVNIGASNSGMTVGDSLKFRVSYSALLRLMNDKYIEQVVVPDLGRFVAELTDEEKKTACV